MAIMGRSMANRISITQVETSNWLYKADHHYLAARLLYLHGLLFAAEENAAFSIELLLKCACKATDVRVPKATSHQLTKLWDLANPPFDLDSSFSAYLTKLQNALYSKHPDEKTWQTGRSANDAFDPLDFLYLNLRKWVTELIPEAARTPTELDFAKKGEQMFTNYEDRHGSWPLPTILKRSNSRYNLL
jgi:hypothetical protein